MYINPTHHTYQVFILFLVSLQIHKAFPTSIFKKSHSAQSSRSLLNPEAIFFPNGGCSFVGINWLDYSSVACFVTGIESLIDRFKFG